MMKATQNCSDDFDGLRLDVAQTGNQWEKSPLPHPVPEDQATDYSCQTAGDDGPAPMEARPGAVRQDSSANTQGDPAWRPQANKIGGQFREAAASIVQHAFESCVPSFSMPAASIRNQNRSAAAHSPDQPCACTRCSFGEHQAEDKSKSCAEQSGAEQGGVKYTALKQSACASHH